MRKLQYSEVDMPYAAITSNNHEQKVYENNSIFLNNGQNFEIKIFNPTSFKIGANISINGQSTNKLLILNPGQEFILDRFLDDKRKMLFETYEINASNEKAMKAIEQNGDVQISFFKEKIIPIQLFNGTFTTSGTFNSNSRIYTSSNTTSGLPHFKSTKSTKSVKLIRGKEIVPSTSRGISGQSLDSNVLFSASCTNTSSMDSLNFADFDYTIETGRIEKGEESNQDFRKVDIQFETTAFHILNFKLLPVSQKETITTQEIRMYCPSCSYRKRKQSWKFCPSCGEQYDI